VTNHETTTIEPRPTQASRLAPEDRTPLLVIAVAATAAFVGGWFPEPDSPRVGQASAADVRAWADANAGALHTAATALMIVAVSFIVVASGLSALARRHLRGSMLSELVVGSAVAVSVLMVLDTAASTMSLLLPGLVDTKLADVSDPVVVGWLAIGGFTHFLGDLQLAFVALALASGSLIARRLGLVNRWLCYGGLVIAGCAAVGTLGITLALGVLYPLWFVGTFGLYLGLLVLAVSALLARRRLARTF
jgi:hypothetical protein